MERNNNYEAIPVLEPLIKIPTAITNNMSTDQKTAWKVLRAVTSGDLPDEVASLKIGVMCHSRWA